jgi:hypothetical protein
MRGHLVALLVEGESVYVWTDSKCVIRAIMTGSVASHARSLGFGSPPSRGPHHVA